MFLVFYFEAWDSLSEIHREMLADDRFKVTVISIPRKLTGELTYGGEKAVHKFLKKAGVKHLRFDFEDSNVGFEKLRDLKPDYVFLNYPWQRNYQPGYRPDRLVSFTRILYTPYFLAPLVDELASSSTEASDRQEHPQIADHIYRQRVHQLASLIFCQDTATKMAFEHTERGGDYVLATGSAKLDSLRRVYNEAAIKAAQKKTNSAKYKLRVLWAPHHSYSPSWLNFGTFAKVYEQMLEMAASMPDIQFILRPHPFLFGTMADRDVISKGDLSTWIRRWKSLPNTKLTTKASFARQFAKVDLLVSDGISFLAEYPLITSKPGIFLENDGHWSFNALGVKAQQLNVTIASVTELINILKRVLESEQSLMGILNLNEAQFETRLNALRREIDPHPGMVAANVLEIIKKDFGNAGAIENFADLKEIAWEDMPGREPRLD